MTDTDFMKIVIKKGKDRLDRGESPILSIIVKDDKIISEGHSSVANFEISGHNDSNAISQACKKLKIYNLDGCTMYSTVEPCSMCLSCAAWAGLTKIVFGSFQEDIPNNLYETTDYHAVDHAKILRLSNDKKMEIIGGVLQQESTDLMKNVKNWVLSE